MPDTLAQLLGNLQSSETTVRKYAAEDLGDLREPGAINPLIALVHDPEKVVQEAAAQALIKIGGEETAREVVKFLQSEEAFVRNFASDILTNMGEDALSIVGEHVSDPDHDVRKFSVDILGLIGVPEATQFLYTALNDEHINVVCGSVEALGNIGDDNAVLLLSEKVGSVNDPWLKYMIIEALGKIGKENALPVLHDFLLEIDEFFLLAAIKAIGNIGSAQSIDNLSALLTKDISLTVQATIIETLEKINIDNVDTVFNEQELNNLLDDLNTLKTHSNPFIRKTIAQVLGRISHCKSADILLSMLDDADVSVQDSISESLIRLPGLAKGALETIVFSCSNTELSQLIFVMGERKEKEYLELLIGFIKHKDPSVRAEIATAFGKYSSRDALKHLLSLVNDKHHVVQIAAIEALQNKNSQQIFHVLCNALTSSNKAIFESAFQTLRSKEIPDKFMSKILDIFEKSKDPRKESYIELLAQNPTPDVINALLTYRKSSNWRIRYFIIEAIKKVDSSEYLDYILSALKDEEVYVRISAIHVLGKIASETLLPYFDELLHDPDARIRFEAIKAIKKYDVAYIGDFLIDCLTDPDEQIIIAALETIGEFQYMPALEKIREISEKDLSEECFMTIEKVMYDIESGE